MKKVSALLLLGIVLLVGHEASAQSISVDDDTAIINSATNVSYLNRVINTTAASLPIQWKIVSSNFPADWFVQFGICDNMQCYTSSDIWPTNVREATYAPGPGDFHFQLGLSYVTTTGGPYYMNVRFNVKSGAPADTAMQTYLVSKIAASALPSLKTPGDISLYPTPAISSLKVTFDAASEISNIAIYNIIGKQVGTYPITDRTCANLDVENIASGIYFIRLLNSYGDVVATRRFTKQ